MKKTNTKSIINLSKVGFAVQKHSPEILMGMGMAGTICSIVSACKRTLKVIDIVNDHKETISEIEKVMEDDVIVASEGLTEDDKNKAISATYIKTGLKIIQCYAVPALLTTLSLGAMLQSHNILKKRNVALASAYLTLDEAFKGYRKRVENRFGSEVEKEIRYDLTPEKIKTEEVDENGKKHKKNEVIEKLNGNVSGYARVFDKNNSLFEGDPDFDAFFLKNQQNYANDLLKAKGRLFLNDVYELLGFDKTKAGQIVGWVYDKNNEVGDNYVDFGIFDTDNKNADDFFRGLSDFIILDFNVDGNILSEMV